MKGLEIRTRSTVAIAFTADQWELFDEPGRDAAATEMNTALQTAINAEGSTPDTVNAAMRTIQEKHSDLGADDGEAQGLIDRVVDKAFGTD